MVPRSKAEVTEVSLFKVAEVPTNRYDYMLPDYRHSVQIIM